MKQLALLLVLMVPVITKADVVMGVGGVYLSGTHTLSDEYDIDLDETSFHSLGGYAAIGIQNSRDARWILTLERHNQKEDGRDSKVMVSSIRIGGEGGRDSKEALSIYYGGSIGGYMMNEPTVLQGTSVANDSLTGFGFDFRLGLSYLPIKHIDWSTFVKLEVIFWQDVKYESFIDGSTYTRSLDTFALGLGTEVIFKF